ncbi:NUDIX hydrolase [Pseudomonas sp. PWP3-1b2]|uniref:NUDIX hydrolase n=1 Tax=Pseudomonas sp. PWP3-1b2 TaxID=2804656 RepID=UPI003CEA410D
MRERKAARLLVISPSNAVLLFRFVHTKGALAGDNYWATPGGGVEDGESFEDAAMRELREETGIVVNQVGASLAESSFPMKLPNGETVLAVERYFVVHADSEVLSNAGWTPEETQVMAAHHWWTVQQLRATQDTVFPQTLIDMLEQAGVFAPTA